MLNKRRNHRYVSVKCVFTVKGNICHTGHKQRGVRGQQIATQFTGHDPGRIWTGSQWDEVPQSRGNSALCGSSASKRVSFPGVPFSPGDETAHKLKMFLCKLDDAV